MQNYGYLNLSLCCALSGLVFCLQISGQEALAGSKSWILRQRGAYTGKQVAYVSPNGAKVISDLCTVMTLAPDWKMTMYSDKSKAYYVEARARWRNRFQAPKQSDRTATKGKSGKIAGLNATQYFLFDNRHNTRHLEEEFWVASDIGLPTLVTDVIAGMARMPLGLGCPLRIYKMSRDGSKTTVLDTLEAKPGAVPDSTFALPRGYHKASSEVEVLITADGDSDFSSLLGSFAETNRSKHSK